MTPPRWHSEHSDGWIYWKMAAGFDAQSTLTITPKRRPEGLKVFLRLNHYDPARAHLAVYNW
jgi:hypothetical protein